MDICHHCQQPIQPGQARYTAGEHSDPPQFAHWDCHALRKEQFLKDLSTLKGKLGAAGKSIEQLRRKL